MTASTEPPRDRAASEGRRAGRELVLELVFRPLANVLVPGLRRLGLSPPQVVLANTLAGLAAAAAVASGALLAGALLVQLKTLLDNADGQLARATGCVTLAGRYLDTVADFVVNAALLAAVGSVTGKPVLALTGFVALTLVLAADYNATELYREAHGAPTPQPRPTRDGFERALARVYEAVFSPLDRLFRRLLGGAEIDRITVTLLANLGLSTQLLALGVCLALGAPEAYAWLVIACLGLVALLIVRARPLRRRRAA